MRRPIFLILCLMFSATFVFAQTTQTIQTNFTVERANSPKRTNTIAK